MSLLAPAAVLALLGRVGRGAAVAGIGCPRPSRGPPRRGPREMGCGKELCFSPEFLRVSRLVSQAGDLILQLC